MTRVRLVEPGGRGGIYHHAAALADALHAAGAEVSLHSANDAEPLDLPAPRRTCVWRLPGLCPRPLRQLAIVLGWLIVGVPSCAARRPGEVVHVQGWFHPSLFLPLLAVCRLRRGVFAFSPHTTFDRRGGPTRMRVMKELARRADVVFAFSDPDAARIRAWGADPVRAPFPALYTGARNDLVAWWRTRWRSGQSRIVLFPGMIRHDKGLDLLIRAAAEWDDDLALAVVGADDGALAAASALAEQLGVRVHWDVGYHPYERFLAAIEAADVVACPHRMASQSGVLALARAAGRPTLATEVGGLPELATVTARDIDPVALTEAVREALAASRPTAPRVDVATPYLEAYAAAGAR